MSQPLPKEVVGLGDEHLVSVTAANDLSAAINDQGRLYTWGKTKGMMAQNARGFTTNLTTPTALSFPNVEGEHFVKAACGRTHMAAVTADGKL